MGGGGGEAERRDAWGCQGVEVGEAARDSESDFWSEDKAVVQRREPVRSAWLQVRGSAVTR